LNLQPETANTLNSTKNDTLRNPEISLEDHHMALLNYSMPYLLFFLFGMLGDRGVDAYAVAGTLQTHRTASLARISSNKDRLHLFQCAQSTEFQRILNIYIRIVHKCGMVTNVTIPCPNVCNNGASSTVWCRTFDHHCAF